MSDEQHFNLFKSASSMGSTNYRRAGEAPQISSVLSRLQKLQRDQESARDEELYSDFTFSPPVVYQQDEGNLRTRYDWVTDEVAVALVNFFHREAHAGRRWKSLTIRYCCAFTQPIRRIIEGAKSSGIFSAFRVFVFEDFSIEEDQSERILETFCRGNSSLEELEWYSPVTFSPWILGALDEILHADSCMIKRLHLHSNSGPPLHVGDPVIDMLEGCPSLERLRLGETIDSFQGYRVLNLVATCPNLREIDLSQTDFACGFPFWIRFLMVPNLQCSLEARKRLHRLSLSVFAMRNRNRYRPENEVGVIASDQDIHELLQVFPAALVDFGDRDRYDHENTVFSLSTTQLLAFNYAGRAQLDQGLPTVLWKPTLERVIEGARNGILYLPREDDMMDQKRILLLSCQASVLFSLLKQNPTVLTAEVCRACRLAQTHPTSLLSSMGLL